MIIQLKHNDPEIAASVDQLQKESYQVEAELIAYPDHPNLKQTVQDIQKSPELFLGYYVKNILVGVISFEMEDPDSLTICRLIVKPSFFGKGIAGKLIKAVEKCEPDIRYIYVQTAKDNLPAIKRYQKSGFRLADTFKIPDGLSIVRYRKSIHTGKNESKLN